jgi:hypothetical protein
MNTDLLHETAEIKQELRLLQSTIQALQLRVDQLIRALSRKSNGAGYEFADLEGIWEGDGWSFEQIQAAKYKIPEDLLGRLHCFYFGRLHSETSTNANLPDSQTPKPLYHPSRKYL